MKSYLILQIVLLSFLLPGVASVCNMTGLWQSVGSYDPVTVVEATDGSFVASSESQWKNVAGHIFGNDTIFLDCCLPQGIFGTINAACNSIFWEDGAGSQWLRPQPQNITLSNIAPRLDDTGAILRVQDGCLANFKGIWYLYGARYQCCPVSEQPGCYNSPPCGWRNATFAVYSSPDLTTWHLESMNIMPIMTDPTSPHSNTNNAYFEPCVLYSSSADHYVLWFLLEFTKAVAVSDSPIGPFESVSWDAGLMQGSDSYFWVDEATHTTYVKHNGPPPPGETRGTHYVSQLTPDLLSVVPGATSDAMMVPALPVPPYYQGAWPSCSEGGGMFAAGGRWYVMAGTCCCFCAGGANAYVWVAEHPLGPYNLTSNIMPFNATQGRYLTGAQQFSVAALATTSGTVPMYIGQRFGSAADGLKCHDFQYWSPLTILADGTVREMSWVSEFTVEINVLSQPAPAGPDGK